MLLGDLGVDVSPPDSRVRAELAHDELVLRRAARVLARVDGERTAFGEAGVTSRERVLVELRGRRVPEDVPAHGNAVLDELVPIGDDRDHKAPSYATNAVRTAAENGCDEARSPRVVVRRRIGRADTRAGGGRRPCRRACARREVRAGRPDRRAGGRLRVRRAVHPDGHRPPPRRADGRAPRAVEPHRPRQDRSVGGRPRRPLRVPPRLPGQRARAGLRLQPVGAAPDGGQRACRLRPRRRREDRARSPCSTGSSTRSTTSTTRTRATGR